MPGLLKRRLATLAPAAAVPLPEIRQVAGEVRPVADSSLKDIAEHLREQFAADRENLVLVAQAMGLAVEAIRRALGVELYDVQMKAAWAVARGQIAEMQTGEGKTNSVAPAAIVSALMGLSVHVATPNSYLATRDCESLLPAYQLLGISAGVLQANCPSTQEKQNVYDCDIVYGTGFEFGFDFLRDQVAASKGSPRANAAANSDGTAAETTSYLGAHLLATLRGEIPNNKQGIQRGHFTAIVDEIDNVLLDDALSPLILCDEPQGQAEDEDACRLARALVGELTAHIDFVFQAQTVRLTDRGAEKIHRDELHIPVRHLRRPWTEYVQQALCAEHMFRQGVHYLRHNDEIRIVDTSTGRIFNDRSWSEGLHQAVEAKEGLAISSERAVLAQVTRQRYFRLYRQLSGMTGTAVGCEREFFHVYGLSIEAIPRRLPCRRQIQSTQVLPDAMAKWAAIARDVHAIHQLGRPVLIGTRTISDSENMADYLRHQDIPFQLLNGTQDAEEAELINLAGQPGAVTIATNLAGRGTDIKLHSESKEAGGLHVVVSEPNDLARVDRQLVGRSARQGDPGSARTYLSPDDTFIRENAPWLTQPIRNGLRQGELPLDISQRIVKIQAMIQRRQAAWRMQLMQRDLARQSLLV